MPAPPPPREGPQDAQAPPLTREELRVLWKTYQCPTVRRLLLEIARLRKLVLRSRNVTEILLERENWAPAGKVSNQQLVERYVMELSRETVVREDEERRKGQSRGLRSTGH